MKKSFKFVAILAIASIVFVGCKKTTDPIPSNSPSLQILFPNGNEVYQSGQQMVIKWNSSKTFENKVSIGLVDSTGAVYMIATDISDIGNYVLNIPSNLSIGVSGDGGIVEMKLNQKTLKIVISDDGSPRLCDISDNPFTIRK